ncbi:hypothetical protein MFIFM68171_01418 [Madurella fahalii]|uniref:Uncharacterized protein n=1 Tax=Madurella fahalii TaxID=1157608 RepID=A0ABQ0G0E3_9PEZI
MDTTSRVCETESGYLWYICTWTHPDYSGCCRVDPCKRNPVGCPSYARGVPVTSSIDTTPASSTRTTTVVDTVVETSSTLAATATATVPVPPETSSAPGLGADIQRSAALSGPSAVGDSSSNGMTLSVSALVGIVVGCAMVAIFMALAAGMWWGRRRREKDEKYEKYEHAERLASSRGLDVEHMTPGLGSVFNPTAQNGPGSIFDRAEGRMSKGESLPGFTPVPCGGHSSHLVSHLSSGSSIGAGLPSSPSELDSTPIHGDSARLSAPQTGAAELESHPVAQDETIPEPRATLNSTQEERNAGTYANSWTMFQDVQL